LVKQVARDRATLPPPESSSAAIFRSPESGPELLPFPGC